MLKLNHLKESQHRPIDTWPTWAQAKLTSRNLHSLESAKAGCMSLYLFMASWPLRKSTQRWQSTALKKWSLALYFNNVLSIALVPSCNIITTTCTKYLQVSQYVHMYLHTNWISRSIGTRQIYTVSYYLLHLH